MNEEVTKLIEALQKGDITIEEIQKKGKKLGFTKEILEQLPLILKAYEK